MFFAYGLVFIVAFLRVNRKQPLFIVDGDSVNINVVLFLDLAQAPMEELDDKTDLKMRIAGIDTPEIKQTCEIEQGKSIDCGLLDKRLSAKVVRK